MSGKKKNKKDSDKLREAPGKKNKSFPSHPYRRRAIISYPHLETEAVPGAWVYFVLIVRFVFIKCLPNVGNHDIQHEEIRLANAQTEFPI